LTIKRFIAGYRVYIQPVVTKFILGQGASLPLDLQFPSNEATIRGRRIREAMAFSTLGTVIQILGQ
jgi:hypothetical protein